MILNEVLNLNLAVKILPEICFLKPRLAVIVSNSPLRTEKSKEGASHCPTSHFYMNTVSVKCFPLKRLGIVVDQVLQSMHSPRWALNLRRKHSTSLRKNLELRFWETIPREQRFGTWQNKMKLIRD